MLEYPKIGSIFKRDEKGDFLEGQFSDSAIAYLYNNEWIATEKVDGTNIRVGWNPKQLTATVVPLGTFSSRVEFGGKTDKAEIPTFLLKKLQEMFPIEKFQATFPDFPITLYGEGYGAKIQKGGGNYIKDGVDFVLFDVLIDGWWLERPNVEDVASKLEIKVVPLVDRLTLPGAIEKCKIGFTSKWGNFTAEGLVLQPAVQMRFRNGNPIKTKVKYKDFHKGGQHAI